VWIYNLPRKNESFAFFLLIFVLFSFFHMLSKNRKKTSDDFYCLFIHMMYMIFFSSFFFALYIPFDERTVLLRFRIFWRLPHLLLLFSFFLIHSSIPFSLSFFCITHITVCVCVNWPCLVICVRVLFHDDYVFLFSIIKL